MPFNDGGYGVLRENQNKRGVDNCGVDLHTPEFQELSKSFGIPSKRVDSASTFNCALSRALSRGGPFLIEIMCKYIDGPKIPAHWS